MKLLNIVGKHLWSIKNIIGWVLILTLSSSVYATQSAAVFKTAYRYDVAGQLLAVIKPDPDGAGPRGYLATRYKYNSAGQKKSIEQIELHQWYDETVSPANWSSSDYTVLAVKEYSYDSGGFPSSERTRDRIGGTTFSLKQFKYDDRGLLICSAVRMKNALASDACQLTSESEDGPDRITKYEYFNKNGRVHKEYRAVGTDLEQVYKTYQYHDEDGGFGMLEGVSDAEDNLTKYHYNSQNLLEKIEFPSKDNRGTVNAADYQFFTYDDNGNLLTDRKRNNKVFRYIYDNLNRIVKKDVPDTSADIRYKYDLRGLMRSAYYSNNTAKGLFNDYDGFGNLLETRNKMAGIERKLSYKYDDNGNRERITHPDGVYFSYQFDDLNRMNGVGESSSPNGLLQIAYADNGKRKKITRSGATTEYFFDDIQRAESFSQDLSGTNADTNNSFLYNFAGQFKQVTYGNDLYQYFGNSNRTGLYVANGLNQYESINGVNVNYDANGNLQYDGGTTYTYDNENRLISTSNPGMGANFVYDPLGRLFQATIAGQTRQFLWDGDALVSEYNNNTSNSPSARYVHGDQVDEPLVEYNGSTVYYASRRFLIADQQGSILAKTGYTGMLIESTAYDAYGIQDEGDVGRFGYTGQLYFPELGLNYYKARFYKPNLGRFLQTDPVGYEDQMNLYAYVGNDPMNMVDPTGMYGRGSGWSDEDWEKFDAAQQKAASAMSETAGNLRNESGKLGEGEVNADGNSASDLNSMADSLDAGAKALNDDGSGGYVANAGTTSGGGFAEAVVGGKTMTIDTSHSRFGDGTNATAWAAGHESLHSAGLEDQTFVGNTAYRYSGNFAQKRAFKKLSKEKRVINPDHVMSTVWP